MPAKPVTTLRPTLLGTVVFVFAACAIAIEFMVLLGLSFADVIGG
jgi:hypothetical protein